MHGEPNNSSCTWLFADQAKVDWYQPFRYLQVWRGNCETCIKLQNKYIEGKTVFLLFESSQKTPPFPSLSPQPLLLLLGHSTGAPPQPEVVIVQTRGGGGGKKAVYFGPSCVWGSILIPPTHPPVAAAHILTAFTYSKKLRAQMCCYCWY